MLKYILEKYGKQGENILSQREENLLPLYIEGYLLKQNFTDPNGEFHTILQLVHEAGESALGTSRLACSAIRSFIVPNVFQKCLIASWKLIVP